MDNIIYLGGFILPDMNAAAQRVVSNAKLLEQLGYKVMMIGLIRDSASAGDFFYFKGFKCLNLPYPQSVKQWYEYLFTIKWYKTYIDEMKPAMVIAYNHPAEALRKLMNYDRRHGIITLSDCTEWYEPNGNALFKLVKGWDINQRMYKVHPMLDGIIVISKYLDDFYKEKGCKTLLLPPLVDMRDEKWNVPSDNNDKCIRLVYAGSTGKNKDRLDMIIRALEKLSIKESIEISFNVIGMTEDQYRITYQIAKDDPIPSYVCFLGRISHVEVIRQLKCSDFQIFLRENNLANTAGFPTKFAESISAGVMVLTNHSSDLKEYLFDGENGFTLNISNEQSLVESLRNPLTLSKKEIREKKMKIDKNTFDYRNYINKAKDFFQNI